MNLIQGPPEGDPALELAISLALVRQASRGDIDDALRVYQPSRRVVAFGRRETRLRGFPAAVRVAREFGFEPVVRSVGGRAVAYTETALVLDVVGRAEASPIGMDQRFDDFGAQYARALRELGVDARVGAVPGEYCPGAQSVNARGVAKLIGTAQRVIRDAWLFSALVVVTDHEALVPVLGEVYRTLEQPFDEGSVGSVTAEVPGIRSATVRTALVDSHRQGEAFELVDLAASTRDLAHELAADHRVPATPR